MWAGLNWLIKDSIVLIAIELVQVGRVTKEGGNKERQGSMRGTLAGLHAQPSPNQAVTSQEEAAFPLFAYS